MKTKKSKSIVEKAEEAMKKAVRNVILEHRKSGRKLAIWKNGKTVLVSPYTLK
jgi:hypothetical protein